MHQARPGTGEHGGQDDLTKALVALRRLEGRHGLPEAVDRPTDSHPGPGRRMPRKWFASAVQDDIPAGRGERKGALAGGDGLVIRAHKAEMV